MADYTLSAKITGDASSFNSAFSKAYKTAENLANKTKSLGATMQNLGKNVAGIGTKVTIATAPLALFAKSTVDLGMKFDSAMSEVSAISGATGKDLSKLRNVALEMGEKTKFSAVESADGLKYMAMAGWNTQQMVSGLPGILNLAAAANEDLGTASDIVTDALTAFGLQAKDSSHFADVLASASSNANTNVSLLGESFKYVAPLAGAMKYSAEDVSVALGLMANAGIKGSQAGNHLKNMISNMAKPTDAMAAMMEKLGISITNSDGSMKSLDDVMGNLRSSFGKLNEVQKAQAAATLFGKESMSGALAIINASASDYDKLKKAIYNSDGAAQNMADTMINNLGGKLTIIQSGIQGFQLALYDTAQGPLNAMADAVQSIVNKLNALSPQAKQTVVLITGIALAIGPALVATGLLISSIGSIVSVLGFLISPIGLVLVGLAALATWFAVSMAKSESFREKVLSLGTSFVDLVKKAQTIASAIGQMFQGNWGAGGDMLQGLLPDSTIQRIITGVSVVQGVFATFMSFIRSAFSTLSPIISSAFQSIGPIFQQIFGGLGSVIQTIVPVVTGFFTSLLDGFTSVGGNSSGAISSLITALLGLNPIVKIVIGLFTVMGPQIIGIFTQILSSVGPLLQTLGGALGQIAGIISTVLTQAFATLAPVIMQIATAFLNIITTVLPVVTSLFNQLVPVIMQLATMFASVVTQLMPLVGVLISSLLPVITTIITVVMNLITSLMPSIIAIINVIMSVIQALLPVIISIVTIVVQVVATIISAIQPIIAFIGMVISAIMAIITPIIVFVANVIASIIGAITPIIQVISGIFTTAFSIIMSIFRGIYNFISTIINSISSVISNLTGVVGGVFNSIYSVASSVMSRVGSFISKVFTGIQNAWNGLTSFVSGVFDGVSSAVQSLVSQVKGFINGVIGGINSAIGIINKIPGVKIGKIPQLQSGTSSFSGGMARMNEGGRGEMVILPSGSQVIPHDATMKYAKESAKNMSGGNQTVIDFDTSNMEKWLKIIANKELIIDEDSIVNTANNGIAKKVRSYPKGGG